MLLSLLTGLALAATPETRMDVELPRLPRDLHIEVEMEFRTSEDRRDRPQNRSNQSLHELAVGAEYRFEKNLSGKLELAVEQIEDESTFFAKQAYLDWEPWSEVIGLRLGQQFLPIGFLVERDNFFSSNPPWLNTLLSESKGVDLGATLRVYPGAQRYLYLEGSTFAGRLVRAEDQRNEAPETAPRILSLKSESKFGTAFATYLEHDLAFFDPVRAYGGGFEWRAPEHWKVGATLLAEYWLFDQRQKAGPDQRTRALVLYGDVSWWRLTAGYRWSEALREVVSAVSTDELPREESRLAFLAVRPTKFFALRAERVIETQDLTLRDEWVGRAILDWEL